jgi:ABC-type transporter Mla MlaB component
MPYVVLVRGDAEVACWAVPAGRRPDLSVVDQLARLQVTAGRLGYSIRLRDAPNRLRELIDLVGLSDILAGPAGNRRADAGEAADIADG